MIFSIAMGADYSFYVKTIETHARAFLALNILAIISVNMFGLLKISRFYVHCKFENISKNFEPIVPLFTLRRNLLKKPLKR